jgi:hypothetical protein
MIASPEPLTAAKISDPRSVLGKQHIHSGRLQSGHQEVVAVKSVRQHHVARTECRFELAQQPQLARAFAANGPIAASFSAPVDKQITSTRRACGEPTPIAWLESCG